jgi:hypothetical protein
MHSSARVGYAQGRLLYIVNIVGCTRCTLLAVHCDGGTAVQELWGDEYSLFLLQDKEAKPVVCRTFSYRPGLHMCVLLPFGPRLQGNVCL